MKQILTMHFWFTLRGELSTFSSYILIAFLVAMALGLIYIKYSQAVWKKTLWRKVIEKSIGFLFTNLFLGLYLWFVSLQVIPVLSARVWFLLWGIEMIVWAIFIYKEYLLVPEKKKQIEKNKEIKKYIP